MRPGSFKGVPSLVSPCWLRAARQASHQRTPYTMHILTSYLVGAGHVHGGGAVVGVGEPRVGNLGVIELDTACQETKYILNFLEGLRAAPAFPTKREAVVPNMRGPEAPTPQELVPTHEESCWRWAMSWNILLDKSVRASRQVVCSLASWTLACST